MEEAPENNTEMIVSLRSRIKEKFLSFLESSSAIGVPNIVNSTNWFTRIMWILCVLVSLCYSFVLVVNSFIEYYQYPTSITISKINGLPATFPAITICNVNPFDEYYSKDYINQNLQNLNYYTCLKNTSISYSKCINSNDTSQALNNIIDQLVRSIANDKNISASDRVYYGYDLEYDMMISCVYNSNPCYASDFFTFWSDKYGNCYTFNSGRNNKTIFKTSETGNDYGLVLQLRVKPTDEELKYAYKTGVHLFIHNQTNLPVTLSKGIDIATGFETYVGVNRIFTNKLKSPYSDCIDELKTENTYGQKLFDLFSKLNITYYDQEFCFTLCYQDKLKDVCNCLDILTPNIFNISFCQTSSQLQCMKSFDANFTTSDTNAYCENACPQKCSTIEYPLTISSATFPTLNFLKYTPSDFLPDNATETELVEFARTGLLKLVVNYDNLYYTSIDDSPRVTVEILFGNLGGQLGIFIGITFLSCVELIEFAINIVIIIYKHVTLLKANKIDLKDS